MIGARTRILGQVPPGQCVDSLADREPTMLGIYPSYLGQIVTEARRRGMGPGDFNLRVVNVGGEVLSAALRAAARETFGADVNDTFAMTEILPVSGRFCASGHLHPDLNMGLVEVVALDGTGTAAPGELGRMVVTPYFPYRDCMPVLRYDTGDVVRVLPDEPPACEFQAIPAVSTIEGKAAQVARSRTGPVTTRDIVEVLEALPSQVWPARYRTAPTPDGGGLLLTVAPEVLDGLTTAEVRDRFADRGVECEVEAAAPGAFLRHVRADLTESTFTDVRTPAGV
jgi:phenylacetate-coenzyme A ligase PaaK-like adenylate-forming protein